jgi:hypothetical protein
MWYFLASLLVFIGTVRYSRLIWHRLVRRTPSPSTIPSSEKTVIQHHASVRRIPTAAVNLFRILAFRSTVNVGQSFSINLAEVAVTCLYIIALFTWAFINSKSLFYRSVYSMY